MRKKHLTLSERLVIERMLNERRADMAREIRKDRSTISREVRNHSYEKKMGCHGRAHNDCRHADACNITGNCKDRYICGRKTCRSCPRGCGAKLCRYFERRYCSHLKKVPYVCNGCRKAGSCTLTKVLYSAVRADEQYRSDLSYYRTGIALTKADAMEIQKEILPLFEQGQSVYAAMKSCGSRIPFSVKTMYTYIDSGVFPDIKNIDLPRKVRYRGRKKKDACIRRKDNWYRDGRRMEDFERFLADNPSVAII